MTQEQGKQTAGEARPQEGEIQGEGDYVAGRRFQDAERSFAEQEALVRRKAREAADALGGSEAQELEAARRESGAGKIPPHPPAHRAGTASDPHVEENLDRRLEETFPASDPVSISPGAD